MTETALPRQYFIYNDYDRRTALRRIQNMQKKFSLKNNRLAKTIILSGAILIIVAFVILRYEGFFSIISKVINIFRPIIIGGVIAFALNRPINFFHAKYRTLFFWLGEKLGAKRKNRRRKSANNTGRASFICSCVTTYIILIAIIVGIIWFIVPQISESISMFSANFNDYTNNLINFFESNKFRLDYLMDKIDLGDMLEKVKEKISELPEYIPTVLAKTMDITSGIIGTVVDTVVGFVFSIYILMDKQNLKRHARILTKSMLKHRYNRFERIIRMAYDAFSNFLSGQLMEAVILGILCFFGMTIFRFDYAPLISVIIGITNMIPIVGPILGTIPCALILLMVNPIKAVWFVVFIIIIQQIDSNLIYPKVVGNSIGLPALWVLFAITVGGGLWGILGMIVGVPLVSILYAVMRQKVHEEEENERISEKSADP